jgi:hypothetical protein
LVEGEAANRLASGRLRLRARDRHRLCARVHLRRQLELGVVHAPEADAVRGLNHDTPPPAVVGHERRTLDAVDDHPVDHPDSVEGRLRRASAERFPALDAAGVRAQHVERAEQDLRRDAGLHHTPPPSERGLCRGRRGPVHDEDVQEPGDVRRENEQGHQHEVKREQLHRHVVGHVEREDHEAVDQAHEAAQRDRERHEQQHGREHFGAADDAFVRERGADRGPQDAHGREVAVRLEQACELGRRHLQGNELPHPVAQQRCGHAESEPGAEPLLQPHVVRPAAIDRGPQDRQGGAEDEQAQDEHPVEHLVAAAAADRELPVVAEDMLDDPHDARAHRPLRRQHRHAADRVHGREHLCQEDVQPEVEEAESKRDARWQAPAWNRRSGLDRRGVDDAGDVDHGMETIARRRRERKA